VLDPNLHEYATYFYNTLNNYLLIYRTGQIPMTTSANNSNDMLKYTANFVIPNSAQAVNLIVDFLTGYESKKTERQGQKVNEKLKKYMKEHVTTHDLELAIIKASMEIARIKKHSINNTSPSNKDYYTYEKAQNLLDEKIDQALAKATSINLAKNSKLANVALKDVGRFIFHIIKSNSTGRGIDNDIIEFFKNNLNDKEFVKINHSN
jgi:hypothetical protein